MTPEAVVPVARKLLSLQRMAGNHAVAKLLANEPPGPVLSVQRLPTDYAAKDERIRGHQLLQIVWDAIRAVLPELTGNTKGGYSNLRTRAVNDFLADWGPLIKTKRQRFPAEREPTAPMIGSTRSGMGVNAGYWLTPPDRVVAPSYPVIAQEIGEQRLGTTDVRRWLEQGRQGGASGLTKLVGEATFGAEPARNPRSFASHLMMYDLLEETGMAPAENADEGVPLLSELYNMNNAGGETAGALPMMGQETYEQGLHGVSPELNPEQRKEAIAICAWLQHVQGGRSALSRDQIYDLVMRRVSSFGDLRSVLLSSGPQGPDVRGLAKRVVESNQAMDLEERAENVRLERERERRQAEANVGPQEKRLREFEQRLEAARKESPSNPTKIAQLEGAVRSQRRVLENARPTGGQVPVSMPSTVPSSPAPVVRPSVPPPTRPAPAPSRVPSSPVPDVTMGGERKRSREDAEREGLLRQLEEARETLAGAERVYAKQLTEQNQRALELVQAKRDEVSRLEKQVLGLGDKRSRTQGPPDLDQ